MKKIVAAFFLLITSYANAEYIIDTGETIPGISLSLISPTSYLIDADGIKDNGQSLAIKFNLDDDYLINSISSFFSVSRQGNIRFSVLDNSNDQPNLTIFSKTLYIDSQGWNGVNDINLVLSKNTYWAVFDYTNDLQNTFNGGLRLYYEGSDLETRIKSNYNLIYQNGFSLSAGLRIVGSSVTVPEAHTSAMLIGGILMLSFCVLRKSKRI